MSEEQAVLFLMIAPSNISLMGHVNALRASGSGKLLLLPRGCSAIFSSENFPPSLGFWWRNKRINSIINTFHLFNI